LYGSFFCGKSPSIFNTDRFTTEPVTSTNQTGPVAEQPIAATDNSQYQTGTLAEQPIAATDSSQYNLPTDLALHAASQNPNEMFWLIDRCTSEIREDLVDFSSLKTVSIARPSTQTNLVPRIFETSIVFNRQLIVIPVKPNANFPLFKSEGVMNKAELDFPEQ
jgi:hypothetical protein